MGTVNLPLLETELGRVCIRDVPSVLVEGLLGLGKRFILLVGMSHFVEKSIMKLKHQVLVQLLYVLVYIFGQVRVLSHDHSNVRI